MAGTLSGAAVLVTGAASGIGRASAPAFAAAGARVAAVNDLRVNAVAPGITRTAMTAAGNELAETAARAGR